MIRQALFVSCSAIAVLLGAASESWADVYMLRDSRGIVYFTDSPPSEGSGYTFVKQYTRPAGADGNENGGLPGSGGTGYKPSRPTAFYDGLIENAARRSGVDPTLIKSVIKVESDFNRFAVSSKGARGLMQLMPETAKLMNVSNVFDPEQNINGGAGYLSRMLKKFGGDLRLALAAYNAGPTAVSRYGGVPPYPETIRYIDKVRSAYRTLSGGAGPPAVFSPGARRGLSSRPAVYTYVSGSGGVVYTDLPVGTPKILAD